MKIIGINYLSESSVCLLENGKIKFAISQERINRKKNWYGIPYTSIKKLLKDTNNNLKDINYFVTCGLSSLTKDMPNNSLGYGNPAKIIKKNNKIVSNLKSSLINKK